MSFAKKGKLGEIQITDSLSKMLAHGKVFNGCVFKGEYLDCGTMEGYIKSFNRISNI
jgi:UTP--glucose-1-phosphate uridylyltransferase